MPYVIVSQIQYPPLKVGTSKQVVKWREGPQGVSSAFLTAQSRLIHRYAGNSRNLYLYSKYKLKAT